MITQPRGLDVYLVLREGPVTDWGSASKSDTEAFGRFFRNDARGGDLSAAVAV